MQGLGGLRSGILNVTLDDVNELYACYMPFVTNGGLFIPTRKQFTLGDEVFVVLELMDEADKLPLTGRVIWITPAGVVTNRREGIGIQFGEDNADVVNKIETHLAGLLNTERTTYTL